MIYIYMYIYKQKDSFRLMNVKVTLRKMFISDEDADGKEKKREKNGGRVER